MKRDKYVLVVNAILAAAIIVSAYFLKASVNDTEGEMTPEEKPFIMDVDADSPYANTHIYDLQECRKWEDLRHYSPPASYIFLKRKDEVIPFFSLDQIYVKHPKDAVWFYIHFFEDGMVYSSTDYADLYSERGFIYFGKSNESESLEPEKSLGFILSREARVVTWDKFGEVVSAIKQCKKPILFLSATPDMSMERLWLPLKELFELVPLMERDGFGLGYGNVCSNLSLEIPDSVKTETYEKLDALITRLSKEPLTRELAEELYTADQQHRQEFMYILLQKGADFHANVLKNGCVRLGEEGNTKK